MQRLKAINPDQTDPRTKQLLGQVQDELGMVPNLFRTLASSPVVLQAYLRSRESLLEGVLPEPLAQRIQLAVSEANGCEYCVAALATVGRAIGLTEEAIADSREASCPDSRTAAALRFASAVTTKRGRVSEADFRAVRQAGFSDGEIIEIVAHVGHATFTNYFNLVAETKVDFPEVPPARQSIPMNLRTPIDLPKPFTEKNHETLRNHLPHSDRGPCRQPRLHDLSDNGSRGLRNTPRIRVVADGPAQEHRDRRSRNLLP